MSVWQAIGFHMVIWLSGLQTIPGDLYEAADLDGAGNVAEVPLRDLAGTAADPDLHPDHHHHLGVLACSPRSTS